MIAISAHIASARGSALARWADEAPWAVTQDAETIVRALIAERGDGFSVKDGVAIHNTARIENGATIKGPALIGPNCFIASSALVRGSCWLERDCIIGPSAELKTSFLFADAKLAHLNFVGDSVLGAGVNIEAGAMIANYRNERADKHIRIATPDGVIDTGVEKFGALVGDSARIGANAVIAPGALLARETIVPRLALVEQASNN